jgi:hypothetical protein
LTEIPQRKLISNKNSTTCNLRVFQQNQVEADPG